MSLVLSVDQYLAEQSSHTWLIEPILPVGGKLLLYGDPKIGKSFAAIQLAEALSGERVDWFGFPVRQAGRVVYIQLDTPRSLWQDRLRKLQARGLKFSSVGVSDRETLETWPFNILQPDHNTLFREIVSSEKPIAVVVDVLAEIHQLDENKVSDMRQVMGALEGALHPAAIVLVTHAKKPMAEQAPNLLADLRGSSYIPGSVDTIMRLTERGLYYIGRAVEGGVVRLERGGGGLWTPVSESLTQPSTFEPSPPDQLSADEWNALMVGGDPSGA